ncbi:MAG: hypothetical protein ACKO6N_10765 [Myxococcota bacterium]
MQWTTLLCAKPSIGNLVWSTLLLFVLSHSVSAEELPPITPPPSTTILGADWTPPPRGGNRSGEREPALSELESALSELEPALSELKPALSELEDRLREDTLREDTLREEIGQPDVLTDLMPSGTSGLVLVETEELEPHTESGP